MPGDITDEKHCQSIVQTAVNEFGRLNVFVNNAAFQMAHENIEEISTDGLGQMLSQKGSRVNCVAPGPIWALVIPVTMPEEKVKAFG